MRKLQLKELNRLDIGAFKDTPKHPIICVLDNVRSGLNVGAVFRTADAFAIQAVYLCGITCKPPHREIEKTAIGASASVEWKYFNKTLEAVDALTEAGFRIVPVEQTDASISLDQFEFEKGEKLAFIFGNEVKGVSNEVIDRFDQSIEIPQFGTKHSLNISVSAGVVLWDVIRRMI
jgi:tRNA G18 (ribose-2'-O)-methylase SpoU